MNNGNLCSIIHCKTARESNNYKEEKETRKRGREKGKREGEKINCYCQETQHKIHKLVASTSDHAWTCTVACQERPVHALLVLGL